MKPTPRRVATLRDALLGFYDAHRRDLPWRRNSDPYRVWISEIMLQQTRVEAVLPYYDRWLTRFPTLADLAAAPLDDVLKQWEGLGYYTRARHLHRAAQLVCERHAGRVPADADTLRQLPGIGDYTAGAIASIAFQQREPAVDGNARRVLARLFDLAEPQPARLRRLAARLMPAQRPGDFNQALMELGATICTPRQPACATCPTTDLCLARIRGTQAERPSPRRARPIPTCDVGTAVITSASGRTLLVRRPAGGLLGGLWQLPGLPVETAEPPAAASLRTARQLLPNVVLDGGEAVAVVDHAFTHRREIYHVFRYRVAGPQPGRRAPRPAAPRGTARWADAALLRRLALPAAQRRIARLCHAG